MSAELPPPSPGEGGDREMPLIEHLTELRTRLIRAMVAVLARRGIEAILADLTGLGNLSP